jgi:malate dehydrogenase (oxaloacetate-decarboxylating)(NADP+)
MADMADGPNKRSSITDQEALQFHSRGRPGKLEIVPTKPMATQRDLSLAYSPGVAVPVKKIAEDPNSAFDYTTRGNLVAVISNGTAILGLGNLGALASKPVMEGKAVLFKRFADVDAIDIEVDTKDAESFISAVRYLGPTFGGINLEDIAAPDCFIIESRLRELMDIPVFHDDQHGTAIITAAGLINALDLTGRSIKDVRVVVNGAGSAGIACLEVFKSLGLPHDHAILCDSKGVIYEGRKEGMNQWKAAHAVPTKARKLKDAVEGADVFLGLSVKGAMTKEMVRAMADKPIIFACANPDPEISPEDIEEVRDDAIVATGRSDYPNQINNLLGFPYIFRGALDVRARTINGEMKTAAVYALAELAREDVPEEVAAAYQGTHLSYGPGYIIPVPFDPRLITEIPAAVAKAAMDSGVARKPIVDMHHYRHELSARLDPTSSFIQMVMDKARAEPKRLVFAEGEEEAVIRAAISYKRDGLGEPILIGREELILDRIKKAGIHKEDLPRIMNARIAEHNVQYTEFLYTHLQRQGFLFRDCQRMVNQDRNVFSACMVAFGHADAMVTGTTRNFGVALEDVRRVFKEKQGGRVVGMSIILSRGRTVFVADTNITETPDAEDLVCIARETAHAVRRLGQEPRVAFVSYSTFGYPMGERARHIRDAVRLLDDQGADFEYDGEMAASVALRPEAHQAYPFMRLKGPANVLIMPAIHSASISTRLVQELGGATVIGPILLGLEKPVQIASLGASASDILMMSAMAAFNPTERAPSSARDTKRFDI